MVRIPLRNTNNTLLGPFRPYRYLVDAKQDGVPFRRRYRTLKGAEKLVLKQGVTEVRIFSIA